MAFEVREVVLNKEPVELYKILKFEGLVGSGGEAKSVIEQGLVKVNDQQEMRKRRKLVAGDVIVFDDQRLLLTVN